MHTMSISGDIPACSAASESFAVEEGHFDLFPSFSVVCGGFDLVCNLGCGLVVVWLWFGCGLVVIWVVVWLWFGFVFVEVEQ